MYNDPRVMEHFGEFRAWAHVSEDFDVFKMTRTIFESVSLTDCNVTDLCSSSQTKDEIEREEISVCLR